MASHVTEVEIDDDKSFAPLQSIVQCPLYHAEVPTLPIGENRRQLYRQA